MMDYLECVWHRVLLDKVYLLQLERLTVAGGQDFKTVFGEGREFVRDGAMDS